MSKPFIVKDEDEDDSPEVFYQTGVKYEVTINPDKQYEQKVDRFRRVYQDLTDFLQLFEMEYLFVPEVSEPRYGNKKRGKLPRIHFHGWLLFREEAHIAEFLLFGIYKLTRWADYCINPLRDDYWVSYMGKQQRVIKALTHKFRLPYEITPTSRKPNVSKRSGTASTSSYFDKYKKAPSDGTDSN